MNPAPRSGSLTWSLLSVVTVLAVTLVMLSMQLRNHTDERRAVIEQLTALEVAASQQNTIVWRAMTQLMAGEKMTFNRTRGRAQVHRHELLRQVQVVRSLEASGETWNKHLGFAAAPELLDGLVAGTESFLAGVQGSFGMMNLSQERMRSRLGRWDMNYGRFETALNAVRERAETIAVRSSRAANVVTAMAATITLLAALLLAGSLGRVRARRAEDIQAERVKTLAASESRFRGLVQHSADLILVVDKHGLIQYASPSSRALWSLADEEELGEIQHRLGVSADALLAQTRHEVTIITKTGKQQIFEIHAADLSDHTEVRGIVLNAREITEAKALEAQLRHQALHDPLTGLPNRRSFSIAYDELSAQDQASRCVLFIDLDGFKLVNDSYGHTVGDQLLKHVASRIHTCLDEGDLLARQGGDEFIVLCGKATVAERIQAALAPPFEIGKGIGPSVSAGAESAEIYVSASIGVVNRLTGLDAEQAAQRADIAMYKAKEAGKDQAIVFSDDMLEGAPERLALAADFRRALERDEFTVVYQPKVGLQSGVTESLEALVRWIHPTRGFVGPDLFIPFAEESGLVDELGRQVLEKACMDAVRWQAFGVVVAVNLSPIQFRNPGLVDEVAAALNKSGLDPKFLELEITESAVLGDVNNTIRVMRELKQLGIRLAIDDFGTGYSNLAHLKHFDVDVLKIDQAFVRGDNPSSVEELSDGAIVKAVIGMAKAFEMHVVAEGVESSNHASELKQLGADLGQGYYFSKPVSGQGIDDFLQAEVSQGKRADLHLATD